MENTLYIVDDHEMLREGIKHWLETNTGWKVTKNYSSASDCIKELAQINEDSPDFPEIIIVDVQIADESGFTLVREILKKWPKMKCIIYSMYDTTGYVLEAKDCGAKAYISKIAKSEEILKCLELVKNGDTYLEERLTEAQNKLENVISILTKQERRIFEAILQGKTNEQIQNEFFLSKTTVETYTSRLYDKIDVIDRADLIARYK